MNFKKTLASLIAAMAMLLMILGTSPASADENSGELLPVDVDTTKYDPSEVKVGAPVQVEGTWDATGLDPQPGDFFHIDIWDHLRFASDTEISLAGPSEEGVHFTWAECIVATPSTTRLECTFTDSVVGHEQIHGTWRQIVTASRTGKTVNPPLTIEGHELEVEKSGRFVEIPWGDETGRKNFEIIDWHVKVKTEDLGDDWLSPLVIQDTFSDNQRICHPSPESLDSQGLAEALNVDYSALLHPDEMNVDIQYEGNNLTFTVAVDEHVEASGTGPMLGVAYELCTASGERDPYLTEYTNTAFLDNGARAEATVVMDRYAEGTGTGRMLGQIELTKTVTGPQAEEILTDPEASFQVEARWTRNGKEEVRVADVTPGETTIMARLPMDVPITLSEVGAEMTTPDITWSDIVWSGKGVVDELGLSRDATLNLSEDVVAVQLENQTAPDEEGLIVIPEPSETPEPSVTPEPTPEPSPVPTVEPVVEKKQLAATGANTVWAAVAGLVLLTGGAGIAARSRLRASGFDTTA